MKSGFVGIVGRPNVGKSTLLNAFLGEKIAITSAKPQTTRNAIRGIYTGDDVQIVFIDTPGIHKAKNKLGNFMYESVLRTLSEVDAIVYITDDGLSSGPGERYITELLSSSSKPKLLAINKIDAMEPDEFKRIYDEYDESGIFDEIFGISALNGLAVDKLLSSLCARMPEGPMYFPGDMITDSPERFVVSEIIREKLLLYLEDEVPHGVAVEIESFEEPEREGGTTGIGAVIYCEKKSHKGIIIGKDGRKLKGVGKAAREEIEALLGTKVFLKLWVKVKEGWRDSEIALSNFGYRAE